MNIDHSSRRVVVTGIGVISSLGASASELWEACRAGRSGARARTEKDPTPVTTLAPADFFTGKIEDFGPLKDAQKKQIRKGVKLMAREIQMGVASAQRAIADAAFEVAPPSSRVGVSFASDYVVTPPDELIDAMAACREYVDGVPTLNFNKWREFGLSKMTPLWQLKYLTNMVASHITIYNEFFGPAFDVTNREASFATALAEAVGTIRAGRADYMLVGAVGTRVHPYRFVDALKYGELSNEILDLSNPFNPAATRPFDARRDGAIPGEGAGALFIETEESARSRGAQIYAEVVGGAYRASVRHARDLGRSGCDAISDVDALRESYRLTLDALLTKLALKPGDVGHVNANARGDIALDAAEALALRDVFGDALDSIPTTSLKGHVGNPGAGSGAIETIASILALQNDALFPTLNYEEPDPNCPVVPTTSLDAKPGDSFVKLCGNSIGQTSAIYVRRYR